LCGVQYLLGGGASVDVGYTYQILDDVAALLFILLLLLFLHFLNVSPLEKLLIGGYLFFQTGLQFFFGYVENYALLSVFMMAFMITGWLSLERKIRPIYPIISFALMIGLHLGAIIFLPAPLILLYHVWRERKIEAVVLMAGGIIGSVLFFHLSNYSPEQFISRIEAGVRLDMLPFLKSSPGGPYPIFSSLHLIDWTNASLFILSFGCFLIPVLAFLSAREVRWTSPVALFLLTAASCGVAFTFIFNAALGMARDWDLLVSFLIPVHFLAIYLLLPYFRLGRESHQVIAVMVILGVLRVGAWIGINADTDRHLQRAEVLTNPGLVGTFPVIYYEALGKAFWHKNDFDRSRVWYERYLTIDSLNPRILGNLAADYDKLGLRDRYYETLKQAARSGTADATICLNLGNEYVRRKDTLSGIGMMRHVLEIDPSSREAHANLAIIYMTQRNYPLAAKYASEAIALGMREPVLYYCAGYAFFRIDDDEKALHYLDSYMSMAPGDKRVQPVLEAIKVRMHGMPGGLR
ncbi:MAG TPA: tetratricopeptide repeat protein, partial [Bacteroidota bacterium]